MLPPPRPLSHGTPVPFCFTALAVLASAIGCSPSGSQTQSPATPPNANTAGTGSTLACQPQGYVRNPFVSHIFTADPSAKVFDGRIYVYASHDLDDQTAYDMKDYHVFSSDDLVNWQDHGVALDVADVKWAKSLYAPDACYGKSTGRYYLYFPNGGDSIGVAVADKPSGPFVDALGKALITRSTPGVTDVEWVFDPTCFVDDDGQIYLYFGGGMPDTGENARVIRLKPDMISLADTSAVTIPAPDFFEASFMHKREGKYYFSYSTTFANHAASLDYMISDNPMKDFLFTGTILPNPAEDNGDNNHGSIVEYQGKWYIFYHTRLLSNQLGLTNYQRTIAMDHLDYAADGRITEVAASNGQVAQLKCVDAFSRMEAETMAAQKGIEIGFALDGDTRVGVNVTEIHEGDWIGVSQVYFAEGADTFVARVASDAADGATIELRVDGCDDFTTKPGTTIGTCAIPSTGSWQIWKDVSCPMDKVAGVHDLCLRFTGGGTDALLNLDYYRFEFRGKK